MVLLVSSRDYRWRSIAPVLSPRKAYGGERRTHRSDTASRSIQPAKRNLRSALAGTPPKRLETTRNDLGQLNLTAGAHSQRATRRAVRRASQRSKCCRMIATNGRRCQATMRRHITPSLHACAHARQPLLCWYTGAGLTTHLSCAASTRAGPREMTFIGAHC